MQQTNKQNQLKTQTKKPNSFLQKFFRKMTWAFILGFFLLQATTKRAAAEQGTEFTALLHVTVIPEACDVA